LSIKKQLIIYRGFKTYYAFDYILMHGMIIAYN